MIEGMKRNYTNKKVCAEKLHKPKFLVGQAGFEPTAPTTPRWCATKLRYCPLICDNKYCIISRQGSQVIPR
jgi:hypothetical protein